MNNNLNPYLNEKNNLISFMNNNNNPMNNNYNNMNNNMINNMMSGSLNISNKMMFQCMNDPHEREGHLLNYISFLEGTIISIFQKLNQ